VDQGADSRGRRSNKERSRDGERRRNAKGRVFLGHALAL
jgi:hypothetical protein